MSADEAAIVLDGLARRFGAVDAVHALNLRVRAGEWFGLVGPNGSGKSTTLKMLTTLLSPSQGRGWVAGQDLVDLAAVRARIGVVFQAPSLDLRLSALENLDFYAALYRPAWTAAGREARSLEALEQMGLAARAREEVGQYSWGMRRRVEVARALVTQPAVLFLDEPTTGLDPQTRAALWQHLHAIRRERRLTIVLATHDMEEAARCDRLGVLLQGHLVAVDTPAGLCAQVGTSELTAAFLALTGADVAAEAASRAEVFRARASGAYSRG